MSLNTIQKLFSEYSGFEDAVLIESPFTELTREGKEICQVHLGQCNGLEIFPTFGA
jgi:hypothetical protein